MKIRSPVQAGAFYSDKKPQLLKQIEDCFLHKLGPGEIPRVASAGSDRSLIGLVVPHAGYIYSGPIAAHAYRRLAASGDHASIVILGPNHTGRGTGVSTMTDGQWSTPLGNVEIDSELAEMIVKRSGLVDVEDEGHRYEHSIEVQLPFLQYLYNGRFKFVPVCMMLQDLETSRNIGEALVESVKGRDVVILASSDWTHYESQEIARARDLQAIEAVLR
ncbi:MAG TPA: AmmeMemoRadiSam system protein B, partial [Dongiaceae bacterium]|nr:AmmeMemoRadiSam system protein B [Dongiaceae bacterium]